MWSRNYQSRAPEFTPEFSGVRVARSLVFCVVFCRSLCVPLSFFLLVIALSVLLRFMDSDYPFGVFSWTSLVLLLHLALLQKQVTEMLI